MAPIKIGLIGLGATNDMAINGAWGVTSHLRSIQGLPELYELVAVANSSVESAQKSIEFHRLPSSTKAYGTAEAIAADPNVELIVICVEVRKHYQLALPALKHKKSLYVEWPLGASVGEAEELTKLATENGVNAMVGLQGRHDPLTLKVKEILASGQIGDVVNSTATICGSLPLDKWTKGAEFQLDLKSGGNEYTIFFGHFLDSFTYLLGDFSKIHAIFKSQYTEVPIVDPSDATITYPPYHKTAPDHIFVQGTLQSSAIVSLAFRKAKAAADGVGFRWYITGTKGEIAITSGEGSWQFGIPASRKIALKIGHEPVIDVDYLTSDTGPAAKVGFPGANTARQYLAFASKGDEIVSFQDALKTHRLLSEIARAAGWEI